MPAPTSAKNPSERSKHRACSPHIYQLDSSLGLASMKVIAVVVAVVLPAWLIP